MDRDTQKKLQRIRRTLRPAERAAVEGLLRMSPRSSGPRTLNQPVTLSLDGGRAGERTCVHMRGVELDERGLPLTASALMQSIRAEPQQCDAPRCPLNHAVALGKISPALSYRRVRMQDDDDESLMTPGVATSVVASSVASSSATTGSGDALTAQAVHALDAEALEHLLYQALEPYKHMFEERNSALVWLSNCSPTQTKFTVIRQFRRPPAKKGNGGYAEAFKALGLYLRPEYIRGRHYHMWHLRQDLASAKFANALHQAVRRRARHSRIGQVEMDVRAMAQAQRASAKKRKPVIREEEEEVMRVAAFTSQMSDYDVEEKMPPRLKKQRRAAAAALAGPLASMRECDDAVSPQQRVAWRPRAGSTAVVVTGAKRRRPRAFTAPHVTLKTPSTVGVAGGGTAGAPMTGKVGTSLALAALAALPEISVTGAARANPVTTSITGTGSLSGSLSGGHVRTVNACAVDYVDT